MIDIESLKVQFWDGKYKVRREDCEKTLEKQFYFNEEGIQIAIKRALGDFTDRTEKLNPESGYKSFGIEEKFKALCGTDKEEAIKPKDGSFVQKFIDYFFEKPGEFKNKESFDDWHKDMCNKFLEVIGANYRGGLKYGKAQKIVNMTFKNAYCLKNEENSKFTNCDKYYEHCHMPLDSVTLEWFKRTQVYMKEKNEDYLRTTRIPSWSKQNYEEIEDFKNSEGKTYYSYIKIQEAISKYFCDKYVEENSATGYLKDCRPFQAEFFVWPYMQLEIAAESLYNHLLSFKEENDERKNEFKKKPINEKLEHLQDVFKDIEKYKVSQEASKN